jgi:hypothetical protein
VLGLGGDDGCKISGSIPRGVEASLDFRHGLLGGEFGEAGCGVLAGEILGGDLLDAGGGEKGDGYGGEKGGNE